MTEKSFDVSFQHPSRWLIYGPSQSGKTSFTLRFLSKLNDLFTVKFDRVIYCCNTFDVPEISGLKIESYPDLNEDLLSTIDSQKNNFLIIDDQMENVIDNPIMSYLFTRISSHQNITVFFLTHNLFPKSKYMRNITINASYVVLMKNPSEKLQIRLFSNRISEDKNDKRFIDAYRDATSKPYGYILVDQTQNIPDKLKFRTDFLSEDNSQTVYI